MNIRFKPSYKPAEETTVRKLVQNSIEDAFHHAEGLIERTESQLEHLTKSFAILVEIMAEKGILTAPEVVRIAEHYDADTDATFTND